MRQIAASAAGYHRSLFQNGTPAVDVLAVFASTEVLLSIAKNITKYAEKRAYFRFKANMEKHLGGAGCAAGRAGGYPPLPPKIRPAQKKKKRQKSTCLD
jgi:hypothetical protein